MSVTPAAMVADDKPRVPSTELGTRQPRDHYLPAVDGLRAIAVALVLLFHAGLLPGGFIGVDILYVISGFLITSVLLREGTSRGRIQLGKFWARRAQRLLPGLFAALGLTAFLVWRGGVEPDVRRFAVEGPAALFYISNWSSILHRFSYWETFGPPAPTSHLWSLAVEEQFYLVWPLLIAAAAWLVGWRVRRLMILLAVMFFLCTTAMPLAEQAGWSLERIYLGTDTHSVGLACGALLAAIYTRYRDRRVSWSQRIRITMAGAGAAAFLTLAYLALSLSSYTSLWLYWGGFALVATLSAIVLASLLDASLPLSRLLATAPLCYAGRLSYAVYLTHLPFYWVLQRATPQISHFSLLLEGCSLTVACALVVHHAIENPLRAVSWTPRLASIAATAVTTTLLAVMVIFIPSHIVQTHASPAGDLLAEGGTAGHGPTRVLALGHSLANDFAVALAEHDTDLFSITDAAIDGCGIMDPEQTRVGTHVYDVLDQCRDWKQRWSTSLTAIQPQLVLIDTSWDLVEQKVDGTWLNPCKPAYAQRYIQQLTNADRVIRTSAHTARVLITTARDITPGPGSWAACFNAQLAAFTETHPGYALLDLNQHLCATGGCRETTPSGDPITTDGTHLSTAGRAFLAPWIRDAIQNDPSLGNLTRASRPDQVSELSTRQG